MRVDIGSSRMMQAGTVAGWMLGAAGWVQIGMLRGESLLSGCAAGLGFIVLAGIMTRLLADGAVRASRDRWGRVVRRRGRRRVARLVLLGHADARLYWCTEPFWRWHSARRGGGRAAVAPPAADACGPDDIDEVCIVEVVQWGGVCLWLTVCPRYPDLLPGRPSARCRTCETSADEATLHSRRCGGVRPFPCAVRALPSDAARCRFPVALVNRASAAAGNH
ncbi:hypothetical protein JOE11_002692 [Robbsia andropogonis]|uniref:hypothetical protein n=1 Tax=Robbsia andropogonis TaxID=28092 RepID=UPI003D220CFD